MQDRPCARPVLVAVALVSMLLFSPTVVLGYGGSEGTGQNAGSGASISSSSVHSYFPYSDGITDSASYNEAQAAADADEKSEEDSMGYLSPSAEEHYERVHAGLAVSRAAWDETFDALPSVRRFALVLEQMIMDGALDPRQAFNLLAIYNLSVLNKRSGR